MSLNSSGAAAGTTTDALLVRNTSTRACPMYGYFGVEAFGQGADALPLAFERTAPPPTTVQVPAGGVTEFIVKSGGGGPCTTVTHLVVTPPDETQTVTVRVRPTDIEDCGGHAMLYAVGAALYPGGAAAVEPCQPSQLAASDLGGSSETSTVVETWSLTSLVGTTCSLTGYVGMSLHDKAGHAIATTVTHGPLAGVDPPVTTVKLAANVSAYWTVTFHGGGTCAPAPSVSVTPPGQDSAIGVFGDVTDCDRHLYISALTAKPSV